jgi:signal transduction protein with GAF and PtsI domain
MKQFDTLYILTLLFAVFAALFIVGAFYWILIKIWDERKENAAELADAPKNLLNYIKKMDNLMLTLSDIHDFSVQATSITSKEELAQFIINSACNLFNASTGSVMLINPSSNMLEIVASRNLSPEVVATTKLKIGQGIAGKVVETHKPIFVEDITTDPRFFRASNVKYNTKSFVCVPMETKGKVLGVLNISPQDIGNNNYVVDKSFLRFITIIADQSAVAFENITLSNNLHKS